MAHHRHQLACARLERMCGSLVRQMTAEQVAAKACACAPPTPPARSRTGETGRVDRRLGRFRSGGLCCTGAGPMQSRDRRHGSCADTVWCTVLDGTGWPALCFAVMAYVRDHGNGRRRHRSRRTQMDASCSATGRCACWCSWLPRRHGGPARLDHRDAGLCGGPRTRVRQGRTRAGPVASASQCSPLCWRRGTRWYCLHRIGRGLRHTGGRWTILAA